MSLYPYVSLDDAITFPRGCLVSPVKFKQSLFSFIILNNSSSMAKRFQYNFTMQSEFQELKDRYQQLEEENNLLKQSLEELIKVNTQLTESIEELNNNGNNFNQNEDIESRFEMLINENHSLREQLENEIDRNKVQKKSVIEEEDQTESLVNVLEELIQSFKNIEMKYESEIQELQQLVEDSRKQFEDQLKKIGQQLDSKINTVEALSIQLKRKDEILENISSKFNKIEQLSQSHPQSMYKSGNNKPTNQAQIQQLQAKIESYKKQVEEKEKTIKIYEGLIANLKGKIMEKY